MESNGRIEFFDILRGYAMLLVVFGHVESFCLLHNSLLARFVVTYHMPLFFFISGFFAYKPQSFFRGKQWLLKIRQKAAQLLIPAFIFFTVLPYFSFSFSRGESYCQMLSTGYFGGLWYLVSLFTMYSVYYISSAIIQRMNVTITWTKISCFMAVAVLIGVGSLMLETRIADELKWYYNAMCLSNTLEKWQFFFLGIICSRWRGLFYALLNNEIFKTIAILTTVASAYFVFSDECFIRDVNGNLGVGLRTIFFYLYRYSAILISVLFFYLYFNMRDYAKVHIGNVLSYIGRNTLSIYCLHYLLLVKLSNLSIWLSKCDSIMTDIIVSGVITLTIIIVSLGMAKILKCSKFISKYILANQ